MNDTLYEQLIKQKIKPVTWLIFAGIVFAILAVGVLSLPLIGPVSFFLMVALAATAYYFLFPHMCVEYEYVLLNHDMEIDVIYKQQTRKHKKAFDIQKAEIIAPKGSPRLQSFHPQKTFRFISNTPGARIYCVILSSGNRVDCVEFEPDDEMIKHMKPWVGMSFYQD